MKGRFFGNKFKLKILGIVVLILVLPLSLILVYQTQNLRSGAASPDKLEAEGGVLSGSVQTQSDTTASGGQYVLFGGQTSTPTPIPTSPPSSGGIYGPGASMTSLANTNVGGQGAQKYTMRFRAEQSSALVNFRTFIQSYDTQGGDYGGGNGGIARFTLQSDDGTSNHFPSGVVLATAPNLVRPVANVGQLITFTSAYTLTRGTLYHIVAENLDSSPSTNYFSGNFIWDPPTQGTQPKFGNKTDWWHGYYSGSWGKNREAFAPILDLGYSNGVHQGIAYIEQGAVHRIGGANMVRQRITPASTRTISQVSVRVRRTMGSSPLVLSIGSQTVNVPGSSTIPTAPAVRSGDGMTWLSVTLPSPVTLQAGQTYYLILSAASGTEYSTDGIREGGPFGYHPSTYFSEGSAESNIGSGWRDYPDQWSSNTVTYVDLQWWAQ